MDATSSLREAAIFSAARRLPVEERDSYLDEACAGDAPLRRQIEELLKSDESAGAFLAELAAGAKGLVRAGAGLDLGAAAVPTATIRVESFASENVGMVIGRYKLMEQLGEGGCGVVYVAEQTEPVRRRVALKVIKLGMDTRQVVARFEAERQALAMMDHPNIAKVLDAGTTQTGRPYFVMELVRGIRITDYCDQTHLSTRERLDLFIQVCQAIQHAHQKGIIHRDIKPSNILVTLHDGVPVPKVIDFGIAKATEGRLTEATVYTQLHQFIGTPAYMSPEQAEMSGLDIDTRSDIYSLGVLLYELLVGSTPFDAQELMASGLEAMIKTIREQEPARPSTKLATLPGESLTRTAKRRSVEASRLVHLLRGDLDWIVLKCLEKDRSRRYETANGLAVDLKRHLNNEPVFARPPSNLYRLQKMVLRNRLAFAATSAVAAALLLGMVVSTSMYVRESQARRQAVSADREKGVALAVAQTAQRNEAEQRQRAQTQELAARRTAYASDLNLIQQALAVHNLGRAVELLKRQVPQSDQTVDLRDWEWRYLWQRCRGEPRLQLGQTQDPYRRFSISSDGKWLAMESSPDARGVSLWDLTQQREVPHPELRGPVGSMAFSPREPHLAYSTDSGVGSTNAEYVVQFWNGATQKHLRTRLLLDSPCDGLVFASDGRALVTFSRVSEDKITFWKLPEGTRIKSVTMPPGVWGWGGSAVAGDLSVAAFATGGKGFTQATPEVALVDLATGKTRWKRRVAEDYVATLAFSPDGTVLASCGGFAESSIRFWNVATGDEIGRPANEHRRYVTDLSFWPDGKRMVSASADQTIRIWDTSDLHAVRCLGVLRGHQSEVRHVALQPPDNTRLVSSGKDGTLFVWDLRAMAREDQAPGTTVTNGTDYCLAPDGKSILTLERPGWVDRRLAPGFEKSEPWMAVDTELSDSESTLFSRDARLLAVGRTNGIVKVWDLERPDEPRKLTVTPGSLWFGALHPGSMRLLVCYGKGNRLEEWDITTGQQTRSWPCSENIGAISSDGRWCLSWDAAGKSTLLDLSSGRAAGRDWSDFQPEYAAFSPDAQLFAVSSGFGSVNLYETTTFREVRKLGGLHMRANSLAFSPNGRRLIAGSTGREAVELWDVESGQELLTLAGQGCFFKIPSLSADGSVLGASSLSRSWLLHLWRAPSWAEIDAAEKARGESQRVRASH